MREQLGGTYSIFVGARGSSLPDPEYLVQVIFGSDPSRTEELFGEVLNEVAWLRDGGEQEYLDKAKEILSTARVEQLRENGFWLNQIRAAAQRGEPFEAIIGFDELLEAMTLDDVAAAAQRYLTGRPLREGGAEAGRGVGAGGAHCGEAPRCWNIAALCDVRVLVLPERRVSRDGSSHRPSFLGLN